MDCKLIIFLKWNISEKMKSFHNGGRDIIMSN